MTYVEWKATRHHGGKHSVVVVNRNMFPRIVDLLSDCDDVAYISIESTEDCAFVNHYTENEHYLTDANNVLNLEFDDVEEDIRDSQGYLYRVISEEQARRIVDFIEDNIKKDIVVHCRAGRSRSAGVASFIFQMYEDDYAEGPVNRLNPITTPNAAVVAALKRAYYDKHDVFAPI